MIFFDLDGTLIDHKKAEIVGVKEFLNKYGSYFELDEESFYKHWCKISDNHFLRLLNRKKEQLIYSESKMVYDLSVIESFL